ncbi:MAG: glutamate racemase [Bacteroidales bacterium]
MKERQTIGVFDSGVGGLSVWRELVRELPAESFVYLADNAHAPYGSKSREFITGRAMEISRFLIEKGAVLIVVACNTATGAAISRLRQEFPIPFVGVEPAVKPAALESATGQIGVLATAQTFNGEHFQRTFRLYSRSVRVHVRAGDGLVELVESGMAHSDEARALLESYLRPMIEVGIDHLVLGCTHYPFLIPVIREILPPGVRIIDPAPAVARQTRRILEISELTEKGDGEIPNRFYTTGDTAPLARMLESLNLPSPVQPLLDL